MALIVEDGSIITGANSYVSRQLLIDYAAARGITLTDVDATDVFAIKAMDYLSMYDTKWKGEQVEPGVQNLAWPRKNVFLGSSWVAFDPTFIPNQLVRAQLELALQSQKGIDLVPTTDASTAFIKREKVDVIETEYSEAIALQLLGQLPRFPIVDALIEPLMAAVPLLKTVRV